MLHVLVLGAAAGGGLPQWNCNCRNCRTALKEDPGLRSTQARQVFLDLDVDGDGSVTRDELMAMAHEFYRSDDPHAPGNRLFGALD